MEEGWKAVWVLIYVWIVGKMSFHSPHPLGAEQETPDVGGYIHCLQCFKGLSSGKQCSLLPGSITTGKGKQISAHQEAELSKYLELSNREEQAALLSSSELILEHPRQK